MKNIIIALIASSFTLFVSSSLANSSVTSCPKLSNCLVSSSDNINWLLDCVNGATDYQVEGIQQIITIPSPIPFDPEKSNFLSASLDTNTNLYICKYQNGSSSTFDIEMQIQSGYQPIASWVGPSSSQCTAMQPDQCVITILYPR